MTGYQLGAGTRVTLVGCLVLAATLVLATMPVAASAKPPKKPKACPTKNLGESQITTRALSIDARTARVVIYTRVDNEDHEMFGCYRKSRRRTLLSSWYSCECSIGDDYGPKIKVAGRFVALNHASYGSPSDSADQTGSLGVVDLADSSQLFSYDTGGYVDELALKPNGSAAFAFNTIRNSSSFEFDGRLVRIDTTGTAVLAAQAAEQDSLALAPNGRHIYWRESGQYRGAPID